jgi:SpoVK/Ycf46/Vps4 family AAA+-type ATPase
MNGEGRGENKLELNTMLLAKFPLIYIVGHEEGRVMEYLHKLCSADKKNKVNLLQWTITTGLQKFDGNTFKHTVVQETMEPLMALQEVMKPSQDRFIYVFKDIHPYMSDPSVIRGLRDAVNILRGTRKTLILLCPVMKVPVELEKHMAVMEWGMPSRKDLEVVLDRIAGNVRKMKMTRKIRVNFKKEERDDIIKALLGLTAEEAENVLVKSVVSKQCFDLPLLLKEKEQIIRKSEILEFFPNKDTMAQVGGVDLIKDYIRRRRRSFSDDAKKYGLDPLKGLLLIGVSGGGKTLVAKVIANEFRVPLLRLDVGKVMAGVVGSSEENMRRVIRTAEAVAPCVLMVDELEKSFSGVKSSNFSDAGTTARVFSSFLTWMQEKETPVYVVATANDISMLPPEVLRKGRFDEIFFVDLPSEKEREEIFDIHITKRGRDVKKFDLPLLARVSPNFTGAEIEQAIIASLYDAFDENREMKQADIVKCLGETVPLATTMHEKVEEIRTWSVGRARPASSYQEQGFEISIKPGQDIHVEKGPIEVVTK